jgi:hypothetical protein
MKLTLAVSLVACATALQAPRPQSSMKATATTLGSAAVVNGAAAAGSTIAPSGWDCDDEANCVEVPACDEVACRTSLDVRIHDVWYDLSGT